MHTSSLIEPIYRTTSANKPIDLGTHRVTLLHRNRRGPSGDGALSLRLSPSPGLVCTMLLTSQLPITDVITAAEIPALSTRFPTSLPNVMVSTSGTHVAIRPNPDRIEVFRARPSKLKDVIFHVINFYDFHQGTKDLV